MGYTPARASRGENLPLASSSSHQAADGPYLASRSSKLCLALWGHCDDPPPLWSPFLSVLYGHPWSLSHPTQMIQDDIQVPKCLIYSHLQSLCNIKFPGIRSYTSHGRGALYSAHHVHTSPTLITNDPPMANRSTIFDTDVLGILLSNKKELITGICNNLDASPQNYTE